MKNDDKKKVVPGGVDEYIANCPEGARAKLVQVRATIRAVAPDAVETVSYFQMPGYSYDGYRYNGMFVWFSYLEPYIRLHVIPPVLKNHANLLDGYKMTASIVKFPTESDLPITVIKTLVLASRELMKASPSTN